ncbi:GNAT family N-acetyltransferase [Fructilactobacillus hinvesii]|uniref:GNAT family N-acetyltransferase n=1 Tax=Fructilactobacillus hinvesii TaxID=2940300 RepID=A0ABY5BUS7_9LACO|nr:GNAT family N-acetyltransferase [Fructilactobacillus hinvesii]USS87756.1 GNAT family N-acetyltransferase [Fructilactobacillus hinvesii]
MNRPSLREGFLCVEINIGVYMTTEIKHLTNTKQTVRELHQLIVTTFWDTYRGSSADENIANYLEQNYSLTQVANQLQQVNCDFYFILVNGKIGGYMKLNFDAAQTEDYEGYSLEVEKLYVLPAFKRQGLGSKLLAFAEQTARDRGEDYMWLGVWSENEKAKAFYRTIGFQQETTHTFELGDDPQTDLVLIKKLK